MEEKINNQKIFSYVPSLIARLILDSNLKDKDIFSDGSDTNNNQLKESLLFKSQSKFLKNSFLTSLFINPSIYPINHFLPHTVVMNIRLKGFQKLISTLSIKDPKDQIEKMISEYLSIITPQHLLKISEIISKNGGEIIKYNDYEFTTIWNFKPKKNKVQRYQKFYAKQALLSACQIMREVDNTEIVNNIKMKISIGIALGETMIGFFGGERKRSEYIVMGDTIQKAELCLNYCLSHEIIISEEINKLFRDSEEITTKEVDNTEGIKLYLVKYHDENLLSNFKGFKIKMKYDKLNMTKEVYENLSKKVYIFASILPQGLVKYLDVDQEKNLKEISVVTIATIRILINKDLVRNLKAIQNIILDIQKATYLTFGSLLYISKTYNGLLVRCVWGMDPGSFLDDTARCISTAKLIGSLTDYYNIKIGIGISTGSCYTGLISLQGDRKQFTLMGKKVNLSRTLADEAFQKIINSHSKKKYLIYCDKKTMKQSQRWFKHIYISEINIYFNKESQELYYETKEENNKTDEDNILINIPNIKINKRIIKNNKERTLMRSNSCLFGEYNRKSIKKFIESNCSNDNKTKNNFQIIKTEIYSPIEKEEYSLQNIYDPFPLLRTHRHNSYTPKIKHYFFNHFLDRGLSTQTNLNLVGNLPMLIAADQEEKNKMNIKFNKSKVIYGYDNEINRCVNIMNLVKTKSKKQFILVKGPLGVGKSLFLRNVLVKFMDSNEELKRIYFNCDDFIFFNFVDPLTATFPYNVFCYIFRKIYLFLKKMKKLRELNEICNSLNLDKENIKNINFVLSMGKKDVNIGEELEKKEFNQRNTITSFTQKEFMKGKIENISYISELEGPFKIKDSNKIDNFFFEMIKMYKNYLNKKYNEPKQAKLRGSKIKNKNKNKVPLILVVDDVHMSDKYSIDFIRYLFNNDDKKNNPFIIILVEQTPFNSNYRPILHRELEFFLSAFGDSEDDDSESISNDKIITFKIKPIMEKDILKDIIIYNFNNYVLKNYPNSQLASIDNKILDFLLMKTFQGIPLLVIELFVSLLKSQKFVKLVNNEFQITQELIDDNDVFDWNNIILPYIYEKITSRTINSLLSFKEILLLKYACTIGTIFDIQTLDKINPLNIIIKREDLYDIVEKLSNEYIIETFENELMNRKTKKCLICKICFPFMREVLCQKFPIQRRASLHAETAKLLSGGKKAFYLDSKIEGKILNRHLIYSEIDVVKEIESKTDLENIVDSYNNTEIMDTNNLTVLMVKDICTRIFDKKNKNIVEGNLEILIGISWTKVSYYVDRQYKIYFEKNKDPKIENDFELKIPIKDIFKNVIIEKNFLEITVAELSFYLQNKSKKTFRFRSKNWQDIFHLDTALTFLRMMATYEKYIYNFGYTKLPLYKTHWYEKKEKKYCANIYPGQLVYYNNINSGPQRKKRIYSGLGLVNQTDKIFDQSKNIKDINRSFNIIIRTTFSILLAYIQKCITKDKDEINIEEDIEVKINQRNSKWYLIYIPTPEHVKISVKKFLDEFENMRREEEELLKLRFKSKYSIFPISLLRQERRMFGSGTLEEKRKQSLLYSNKSLYDAHSPEKKEEPKKIESEKQVNVSYFGRKANKSRTIIANTDVTKELGDKIKADVSDYLDNLAKEDSSSMDDNSSSNTCKKDMPNSIYFSNSDSDSESGSGSDNESESESENNGPSRTSDTNEKKNLDNQNNLRIINPRKMKESNNTIDSEFADLYEDVTDSNNSKEKDNKEKDKKEKDNKEKDNKEKDNKGNILDINNNNNYNISNIIKNNININVINNNYLKINAFRMSFQEKDNKLLLTIKPRQNQRKSNSTKISSLKEKIRNSLNYYLHSKSTNKMSLDNEDEEQSISSDKESENSNLVLSPKVIPTAKKKRNKSKNSKFSEVVQTKEDIFWKVMVTFLAEDNNGIFNVNKNCSNSNKFNNKFAKMISNSNIDFKGFKNLNLNRNKLKRNKRSSLCTGINIQIKNRNRHVTFTQKINDGNHTKFRELLKSNLEMRSGESSKNNSKKSTEDSNFNNIRRIQNK